MRIRIRKEVVRLIIVEWRVETIIEVRRRVVKSRISFSIVVVVEEDVEIIILRIIKEE